MVLTLNKNPTFSGRVNFKKKVSDNHECRFK